ncbi:hypothetical protein [Chelativorans sp. M5D2P16]|uniref:hypothetical protein n=1 Tax=Chelativorans sp. M5D2P16 TaxID=3095678 RepID=UPI002ACA3F36|nr:hypothetical protein [Chelativorans sp. M5D2P16]MDZ5699950.1 hypothetical protein [Chelativorans sp. M5D2P16]
MTMRMGLTGAADKLPFFTGEGVMDLRALTAFARTFLAGTDAAAMRGTIGAVNKAGDTMTGALQVPGLTSTFPILSRPIPWGSQSVTLSTGEVETVLGGGQAFVWANFSGLMIINNKNLGGVQVAIGGGGSVAVIATVGAIGAGTSWTHTPAQSGYGFVNDRMQRRMA